MIEHTNDPYYQKTATITCDECGDQEEVMADTFEDAVTEVKKSGWWIERDEDLKQWFHYCRVCKTL